MTILKKANIINSVVLAPLNKPEWPEYSLKQIKIASIQKNKESDLGGFDIEAAISEHPDNLFVKIFAIKKDEVNDNGDCFSETELIKATPTFIGVPVFCNHQNDDIEKARGVIAHAWYDKEQGGVYTIARVDRVAYPGLARGIEEKIVIGTSMGASRGFDLTLMADGTQKRVDKLKVGDEVVTHKGNKEKITAIHKTQKHKELYNIRWNGNRNLALSHEHPVLVLPYENLHIKRKADKIYRKNIKDINDTVKPVFKEASLVKTGDYVLEFVNQEEKDIGIDKDVSFILGVYAAEGYVSEKNVGFCFGLDEETKENGNFVKLINILEKKYPNCKVRIDRIPDRNGLYVVTWNGELSDICKKYVGCGSHYKFVHPDLLSMGKEKQKIFLSAYLDGDGCIVKQKTLANGHSSGQGAMQVSSASISLLNGARKTCLRLGTPATLSSHNRIATSSTVVDNDKEYVEHILCINNTISKKLEKYSWKAKKNKKALRPKFDSFFYKDYIAHRIKSVEIIDNEEDTYYVQVGELNDENSDHSYILNDISTHNCSVTASICSICHTCAAVADDYCDCIKHRKNKKFSGKVKCEYHNSSTKVEGYEDTCPICGSTADKEHTIEHEAQQTFEHNYGIKFIEDSFVVNPACHDCLVQDIFNITELQKKVASLKNRIEKFSQNPISTCTTGTCNISNEPMKKVAGKTELEELTKAMDIVEKVAKSMMSQKEYVSMEYVSDLVKALADIQSISDELAEMGYGQIPSPQVTGEEDIELPKTSEDALEPQQVQQPQQLPTAPVLPTQQPSGSSVESINDLGTITKPKLSEKKKEFIRKSSIVIEKINNLKNLLESSSDYKESEMTTKNKDNEIKLEKVAEHNTDVISEKQLNEAEGTGDRWNEAPEVITEKQLDDPNANKDAAIFTTSDSPQERKGSYDVITEKQFNSVDGEFVATWNDYPEVITEKQWGEMSRLVGSVLSKNQDDIITEKQMGDFLSHHRYVDWDVTTEKQLNASDTTQTDRWAYTFNKNSIIKAAMNTIADTIAFYHKTPKEVLKAACVMNDSPKNLDKSALLMLVNAMPHKAEIKENEKTRYGMFSKLASSVADKHSVDALIQCASDNIGDLSADDVIQAIKHIASSKKGMEKVNKIVKEKLSSKIETKPVFDKTAEFDSAINEIDRPEDGIYEIRAMLNEISADHNDKEAFVKATTKFANEQIDDNVNVTLTKIDIDTTNGVVIATVKETNKLTEAESKASVKIAESKKDTEETEVEVEVDDIVVEEDKEANTTAKTVLASRKEKRENLVKEAQMLGGEMGGQGGAGQAPGAGATLPAAPGQEAPLESFEASDLGEDILGGNGEEDLQPKPPGTTCPVCTSTDVDIIKGKGRCNNCGSEMTYKVIVEVDNWAGTTSDSQNNGEEEEILGGEEGEGFELPEPGAAPVGEAGGLPMAASTNDSKVRKVSMALMTKITTNAISKIADKKIVLGSVSPVTGNTETLDLGSGEHLCLDTGIKYKVAYAVDSKKPGLVYGQWEWTPPVITAGCPECVRTKQAFVTALGEKGITESEFDALSPKEKGKTILSMKESGLMKRIKVANKTSSVLSQYKTALAPIKEFPYEICREKIARRYGLDSVALSGPYEGQPLCDAICKILKNAKIYSNSLALKVASIWSDKDGSVECIEDYIREGFDIKQSSVICESLKAKYAQFDDELADDLVGIVDEVDEEPMVDEIIEDDIDEDIDPFVDESETVTIELPKELAEQLDEQLDVVLHEGVGDEGSLDIPVEGIEVEVEVPEDIDSVDDIVDENEDIVDENEGIVDNVEDIVEEAEDVVDNVVDDVIEDEDEEKDMKSVDCENFSEKEEGIEEQVEEQDKEYKEGEPERKPCISPNPEKDCVMAKTEENILKESEYMKAGHINKTNEINMDLSSVIEALKKQAAPVGLETAQDAAESAGVKQHGDSTIGDEDSFIADSVSDSGISGKSTMGEEPASLQEQEQASAPVSDARMKGEKDKPELKPELDDKQTGGEKGQGNHAASTKDKITVLAENILEQMEKQADEKKTKVKPSQEQEDVKPYSGDSYIKNEKESIGEVPEPTAVPDGIPMDDQFIKNEKESIGEKPDNDDSPSIPAKDDRIKGEKDNEKIAPEKEDELSGKVQTGVTASSDEESTIKKEAFKLAGRMLQNNMITPEQLVTKVAELEGYAISQLNDLEKGMFNKKGLDTPADGFEGQAVIVSEVSTEKEAQARCVDPQSELRNQLQEMFTLDKQIKSAQNDNDIEFRKLYGRI